MAAFVTSIGCYFGMFPFHWFHFEVYRLLRIPPEIWRPVSSFFLTTPKLGIILDPYHGKSLWALCLWTTWLTARLSSVSIYEPTRGWQPQICKEGRSHMVSDYRGNCHNCKSCSRQTAIELDHVFCFLRHTCPIFWPAPHILPA